MMFSLGAFFGGWGKSSGCTDQVKSARHAPVEPEKEPIEGEIGPDESRKILKSPPSIPRLEFDNMPNLVGTKPDIDKPLGWFISSPSSTFLNEAAQKKFDDMRSEQEMSPNALVRRGVQTHRSPRLTIVTEFQKAKPVVKVVHTAMKQMGQTAALQACFNESFDKGSFMAGLTEDAWYTRMMVNLKKVKKSNQSNKK